MARVALYTAVLYVRMMAVVTAIAAVGRQQRKTIKLRQKQQAANILQQLRNIRTALIPLARELQHRLKYLYVGRKNALGMRPTYI